MFPLVSPLPSRPLKAPADAGLIGKATVLGLRKGKTGLPEAYITFEGADKRLDSWVPESQVGLEVPPTEARPKATDEAAESTVPLKKQVRVSELKCHE